MGANWNTRRVLVGNPEGTELIPRREWRMILETCHHIHDQPWGPTSLLYNGYRVFPGGKEPPGRDADSSPPSSAVVRKGRVIPLLPLWAVRPVQSLSACTKVTFTLHLPYRIYTYNRTITGYNDIPTCGKPPTCFGIFRPSSERYATKENTIIASYVIDK